MRIARLSFTVMVIVLGGPEQQRIVRLADSLVTGWGDVTFLALRRQLVHRVRTATLHGKP